MVEKVTFGVNEVVRMMVKSQNTSKNKMVLKFTGMIVAANEYLKQDKTKGYRYTIREPFGSSLIDFSSTRLLKLDEKAEVLLTLYGFQAYEALR